MGGVEIEIQIGDVFHYSVGVRLYFLSSCHHVLRFLDTSFSIYPSVHCSLSLRLYFLYSRFLLSPGCVSVSSSRSFDGCSVIVETKKAIKKSERISSNGDMERDPRVSTPRAWKYRFLDCGKSFHAWYRNSYSNFARSRSHGPCTAAHPARSLFYTEK